MSENTVYLQSEDFKRGHTHGFYDCKPDDGAFYGDYISPWDCPSAEAAQQYQEGYHAGWAERLYGKPIQRCHDSQISVSAGSSNSLEIAAAA